MYVGPERDRAALLRRVEGIPPGCGAEELFGAVPSDLAERPVRKLGEDFVPAVFVLLQLPGYYRPMASFREGRLVLFDAMNPELDGGFAPLHQELGEPAARLDWEYGTLPIPGGEWVYPERGLTVFLNTTADRALHIAAYHAMSLDEYVRSFRPHLGKRPLPKQIP